MSMISALIDELNKSADEWNNSNMFELARMCREAADTIWQLRDDLQRTNAKFNAENAKLREERDMYRDLVGMMDHPDLNAQLQAENAKLREERDHWHVEQVHAYGNWEDAHKRATELAAENSELRKLVRDIYDEYRYLRMRFHRTYVQHEERMRAIEQRMRELGVEVE